ncbi:MAG: hypothetical protein CVV27_02740 [Candidatus Melainabacteria bacterium HGW-Melainabacteria-1]|nr:MAG: hypothetical protein CVV27_02740 [Candidatus Melainabacteria bacterium HGW-Melainabacteria-1]
MIRNTMQQDYAAGLGILIDQLKAWEDFPNPTPSVLEAWSQSVSRRGQLMIPLGASAQGQWLKVQRRALEDLARLAQTGQPYDSKLPGFCPACERRLTGWDCLVCGYQCLNLERYIKETLASMHPAQHLPFQTLLLPDPLRKRLLFLDLAHPGHVLWEIPLDELCRYPAYAQYLPEHQVLIADPKGQQVLICDLLGHLVKRIDCAGLGIQEPVMATALLAAEGERRYLIVDRAGDQVLIVNEDSRLCWRCEQTLSHPSFATLTADQTLLIADTGHGRVLELTLPHGRLIGTFQRELSGPVWVQRLENKHLLVIDQNNARLHQFRGDGQHLDASPLNLGSLFRPLQIYLRRNGQLVIAQSGQAWEVQPGATQWSGFWDFEQLICQELPVRVAKPVLRQARKALALRVQSFASLGEALAQTALFGRARADVLALARKLCRCIRLHAGQKLSLEAQPGLIYVAKGQFELLPAAPHQAARVYAAGALLGDSGAPGAELAGRELRALVPTRIYVLTHFSIETLLPYLERQQAPEKQLLPAPDSRPALNPGLGERVKRLLSRPVRSDNLRKSQGVKFNLFYTPAERDILLAAEDYRYRSYEVHLQFLPQGQQLDQLVHLFQVLKAHGFLVKHRWFEGGRLLVAHVILNGVDTEPLKLKLAALPHLDRYWVESVVFSDPDARAPRRLRSAGA